MKYYITNPVLDAEIKEIKGKIRLSMNGITSDQMKQNGIIYKQNYGVSIPRIKEIAASYGKKHDLAQRLWNLDIRETMIMATLTQPVESFSMKMANEWAEKFDQIEIVEQTTMNLFCKLPFASALCTEWIKSDKKWIRITGFILAARIYHTLTEYQIQEITDTALSYSKTEDYHLYKALTTCLSRFCRTSKDIAFYISQRTETFANSEHLSEQFIYNGVKQEILFLNIL